MNTATYASICSQRKSQILSNVPQMYRPEDSDTGGYGHEDVQAEENPKEYLLAGLNFDLSEKADSHGEAHHVRNYIQCYIKYIQRQWGFQVFGLETDHCVTRG